MMNKIIALATVEANINKYFSFEVDYDEKEINILLEYGDYVSDELVDVLDTANSVCEVDWDDDFFVNRFVFDDCTVFETIVG